MDTTEDILRELMENIQVLSRTMAHNHMTALARGEIYVLNYLIQHDGLSLQSDLHVDMEVSKARVSSALHMLEEKQYIQKETDPEDKRRIHIRLTEKGTRVIQNKREQTFQDVSRVFSRLSLEEQQEYLRLTKKILQVSAEVSK